MIGLAFGFSAPGLASTDTAGAVSTPPSRFMKAAIWSRVVELSRQYVVAPHPTVTPRCFIHSTLGQNGLAASTSVKASHGNPEFDSTVNTTSLPVPPT